MAAPVRGLGLLFRTRLAAPASLVRGVTPTYGRFTSLSTRNLASQSIRRKGGFIALGGALAGVGTGGVFLFRWFGFQWADVTAMFKAPVVRQDAELLENDITEYQLFVHPYKQLPWYQRAWITMKRAVILVYAFTPLALATLVAKLFLPYNEGFRAYWCKLLLRTFERAGCTYQKFAQWISMRPDVFPEDLVNITKQLLDHAPEHPWEYTCRNFEECFGVSIDEVFEEFGPEPIASGTVGQVYRARLRPEYAFRNGERDVAVKVRHPSVLDETYLDVNVLAAMGPYVHYCTASPLEGTIAIPFKMDFFEYRLQQQLDFHYEAYNLAKFARSFRKEEVKDKLTVKFPRVHPRLLSDSVLVESWVEGHNMSEMFRKKMVTDNMRGGLAKSVFDMTIKMFLRDNYVHGDLHAGNLMVSPEGGNITVIDAGMATTLPGDLNNHFGGFLRALVNLDSDSMAKFLLLFHDFSNVPFAPDTETVSVHVEAAIKVAKAMQGDERENPHLADVLGRVFNEMSKCGVIMRGDVAATMMTMTMAEGLIRYLDPEFDFIKSSLPYFVRYKGWTSTQSVLDHVYLKENAV